MVMRQLGSLQAVGGFNPSLNANAGLTGLSTMPLTGFNPALNTGLAPGYAGLGSGMNSAFINSAFNPALGTNLNLTPNFGLNSGLMNAGLNPYTQLNVGAGVGGLHDPNAQFNPNVQYNPNAQFSPNA